MHNIKTPMPLQREQRSHEPEPVQRPRECPDARESSIRTTATQPPYSRKSQSLRRSYNNHLNPPKPGHNSQKHVHHGQRSTRNPSPSRDDSNHPQRFNSIHDEFKTSTLYSTALGSQRLNHNGSMHVWMARAGKEIIRRLTAPELREIVREELANALQPVNVRLGEVEKRFDSRD
jgi:hypothetical protein